MEFLIRPYRETDAEAVMNIINDSIINTSHNYDYDPKTLEEVRHLFQEKEKAGHPILIGESENQVCGYATYGMFRAKPGYRKTIEHSIYLTKKVQGKGLGMELMKRLIDLAKNQGYHAMIAGMDSKNLGSYHFHQRLGFVEVARIPEVAIKFNQWQTLVFMQLILTPNQTPV